MATAMTYEDDQDIDLNEPVEMESLEDQETTDLLAPARKVPFTIIKAQVRTRYDNEGDKSSYVKRLALQVAVGPDGTDKEGANANRRLFPEYVIAFTKGDGVRESDWWQKKARGPAKELFAALGYPLDKPPRIDADFLNDELPGKEFFADIIQREIEQKTDEINEKTGKPVYRKTGEHVNELRNHRRVKAHE